MRVDVALVAFVLGAPHLVEQVVARPGATRLAGEAFEDVELQRREVDAAPRHGHLVAALVDDQLAHLDAVFLVVVRLGRPLPRAPQQRLDPHFEFARAEGLGEVVVGAGLKARDLVVHGVVRRQEHRGRLDAAVAHALEQLDPAHPRHRDVEDEEVEAPRDGVVKRLLGALPFLDLEALAPEVLGEQHPHAQVVVYYQNPKAHASHLNLCRGRALTDLCPARRDYSARAAKWRGAATP